VVIIWAVTGPFFGFSDTWQLVINTGTTIVTFLMVFLIQNTQNRDTEAIQLKLDELIRASTRARNQMLDLEDLDEDDLERVKAGFKELTEHRPETADELRKALHEIGETKDRPKGTGPRR
jgi:low affinity Fe/Cu permease